MASDPVLYTGFDCSTQSLTAVVIEVHGSTARTVFNDSIQFDSELPEFGTRHGIGPMGPGGVVHAPPALWAAALSRMLERVARKIDGRRIRAISGSAQQHGSVYCGDRPDILTRLTSPIWMDTSTLAECREIEDALGGPGPLAQLTGSRAFPRFTGPQIRKFAREAPDGYGATTRIHLVSSYLASILLDAHAAIDHADGSGMNLMDLRTRRWSQAALNATAPDLEARLPDLVPSSTILGTLAPRWQNALGWPATRIVAWSGDNPCSLVGAGVVAEGQLAISLGTSDTIFGPMREPRVSDDGIGHVFASPTGEYMGITVFRNGSLARERVRDRFALSWDGFAAGLASTPAGNGGARMVPWFEPEITPPIDRPMVLLDGGLADEPSSAHVRAVVEAQMMAMQRHSTWMGVTPSAIHATGGATANRPLLQVMADVFNAPVYYFPSTDGAALGAALRAWQADTSLPWSIVVADAATPPAESRVDPIPENVKVYRTMRPAFEALEADARARAGRS